MSFWNRAGMGCALAALTVAGCHKQPEGQVVATVDGKEVTQQEIQAEAQSAQVPPSADPKLVRPAMAERVIDRKLVVDAATKMGLDKSPDYLVQKKRLDESLLAQQYLRKQLQSLSVPTEGDITQYIANNPTIFADRTRYTLDQIRFAIPKDPAVIKQLGTAKTMPDLIALLTKNNITFQRGNAALDSGTVQPKLMKAILGLPPTEPFIVPSQGLLTASVITGKTPMTVPDADQHKMATTLLRRQNEEKALKQQIEALKASAKITYQPGYAPPPTKAGAGDADAGGTANP